MTQEEPQSNYTSHGHKNQELPNQPKPPITQSQTLTQSMPTAMYNKFGYYPLNQSKLKIENWNDF
jgi:hypothetical protein